MPIARVDQFIDRLVGLDNELDIKNLCNQELSYLRNCLGIKYKLGDKISDDLQSLINFKHQNNIENPIEITGNNASNLKNQVTKYRNSIRLLDNNSKNSIIVTDRQGNTKQRHIALNYFNINGIEKQDCISQHNKRLKQDTTNLISFNPIIIINKAIELLDSNSYIDKVLGLYLLTGRRHEEILASLKIHEFDNETIIDENIAEWLLDGIDSIVISGLVKQKDKPFTTHKELIPVLCDPQLIVKTIQWLRDNKPQTKIIEFYKTWQDTGIKPKSKPRVTGSKELGERVKKHFKGILPSPSGKEGYINPHNLRSAYCAICKALYDMSEFKEKNLSFDWFTYSIIRHNSETAVSSQSYLDYQLSLEDCEKLVSLKSFSCYS